MEGRKRILLLLEPEDDPAWISRAFEGSELAFDVRVCGDAASCRAALAEGRCDVLLCSVGATPALLRWLPLEGDRLPPTIIVASDLAALPADAYRMGAAVCWRGGGEGPLRAAMGHALAASAERTEQQQASAFQRDQLEVLELIARGAPTSELLERIVRLIERQADGMLCSILLLDRQRNTVHHGAAPNLPREFVQRIDGSSIGPRAGSCGTAAYLKQRVIVEDIASHEYWQDYRSFALPFGLRACWSSPIFSAASEVLGTFAMYFREARGPTSREVAWVDRATHLTAIVLDREQAMQVIAQAESALRRSEAEFRAIFQNAAIGMALVDGHGHLVRSNPALQRILGYSSEELSELTLSQCTHREDAVRDAAERERLLRGERERVVGESRFLRKDGREIFARVSASAVPASGEVPALSIVMLEDTTERRLAEEEASATERRHALVHNSVSDVLFYIAVEPGGTYRFLSVNPAFLRATGLSERAVIGHVVQDVIPASALPISLRNYSKAISEKRTVRWLEVARYPTGLKYGEASVTPLLDDDGTCRSLVGTVHDITEQRQAQERIEYQAALLDQANDAILVRDINGIVQYWNKGAERLYGWSSQQAVGHSILTLLYRDRQGFERAQRELLAAGQWKGELAQHTRAGKPLVIEASWTLLRDEKQQPKSVFAINTDITDRRELELEVFRAQRMESLGILAGGIAHDFNNILTGITANASLGLLLLPDGHQAREALSEINDAGARAAELVRQILTFSRQQQPERRSVELEPIVLEALKLLKASLRPGVQIQTDFSADVPEIYADPTQVHQVMMNLGTNAAQAMGRTGLLRVSIDRASIDEQLAAASSELSTGEYARLVVSDTGSGIDAATLEHIFNPFFTTKDAGSGTGLGLAVVHGIVKSHDGAILVRSEPGAGSEFSVYFPALTPH